MAQREDADGPGEGGVHGQQGPACLGDGGDGVQVADARGGVAGGFHMNEFGVRPYGGPHGVGVRGVQKGDLNAVLFRQVLPEKQVGGAITDLGDDSVVTTI